MTAGSDCAAAGLGATGWAATGCGAAGAGAVLCCPQAAVVIAIKKMDASQLFTFMVLSFQLSLNSAMAEEGDGVRLLLRLRFSGESIVIPL